MRSLEQAKNTVENLEERLSQAEGVIPDGIEVSGAGRKHINGLYVRDDKFRNGAPLFVKEGDAQIGDSHRPDEIFLDEKDWWRISNAYYVPHSIDHVLLPPQRRGWASVSPHEDAPVPTLKYRFNCPENSCVDDDQDEF